MALWLWCFNRCLVDKGVISLVSFCTYMCLLILIFVGIFYCCPSIAGLYFLGVIVETAVVAILVLVKGAGIERVVGEFVIFVITGEVPLHCHLSIIAGAIIWLSEALFRTCVAFFLCPEGVNRTLDVEEWKSITISEAIGRGRLKTRNTYSYTASNCT